MEIINYYFNGVILSLIVSGTIEMIKLVYFKGNIRKKFLRTIKFIIIMTILSWIGLTWEICDLLYRNIKDNGNI